MKRCTCCNHTKEDSEFGYHPRTRDKLKSWCLLCTREQAKASYQLHKNERRAVRAAARLRRERAAA